MLHATPQSLLEFFDQHIAANAPERRKLSAWTFGCNHVKQYQWAKDHVEQAAVGKAPPSLQCEVDGDSAADAAALLRDCEWVGASSFREEGQGVGEAKVFAMFRQAHGESLQPPNKI